MDALSLNNSTANAKLRLDTDIAKVVAGLNAPTFDKEIYQELETYVSKEGCAGA